MLNTLWKLYKAIFDINPIKVFACPNSSARWRKCWSVWSTGRKYFLSALKCYFLHVFHSFSACVYGDAPTTNEHYSPFWMSLLVSHSKWRIQEQLAEQLCFFVLSPFLLYFIIPGFPIVFILCRVPCCCCTVWASSRIDYLEKKFSTHFKWLLSKQGWDCGAAGSL